MSNYKDAIPYILKHEGVYSDNPADPGGPTNYGISLNFLKMLEDRGDINRDGVIDIKDIQALTLDDAMKLYFDEFWKKYKYESVISQPIATKLLDLSVNMGPNEAHKIVQQSVNRLVPEKDKLIVDGQLGAKSFAAINAITPVDLMRVICAQAVSFYNSLVIRKPKAKVFLKGWLNRANANCGLSLK